MAMGNAGFNMNNRTLPAVAGRTAVAAIVGGTASAITGGKFSNGARTAAMMHLLNAEGPSAWEKAKWSYEVRHKMNGGLKLGGNALAPNLTSIERTAAEEYTYFPKGTFVVVAHGSEHGMYLSSLEYASDAHIREFLEGAGYKGDRPIFLQSCYSGENGVAQRIANMYPEQFVIAPNVGMTNLTVSPGYQGERYFLDNPNAYYKEYRTNQ
ncbi:hypothetical protein, partial [Pseudoalteromonas sp. OOF1S-7]|uniref:hypothetical protein n=1 Tax=Pseudoalteromonas sp. OOF1S-7 TaxID=2917757 RepID=UPI001EF641AF